MSGRFARLAGLFVAAVLAAGCASMQGFSTQATLRSANDLAAQKSLVSAGQTTAAWPTTDWWRSFNVRNSMP